MFHKDLGQREFNLVVLGKDVWNRNKQTPNSSYRVKPFSVLKQSKKGKKGKRYTEPHANDTKTTVRVGEAIKSPNYFYRTYSKFFHVNNYTPDTVIFNCRYWLFLVGAGREGKEIATPDKEGGWVGVQGQVPLAYTSLVL